MFPIYRPVQNLGTGEPRQSPSLYAQMRREAPIYRTVSVATGNPVWYFTRYEDCVAVLKDPRIGKEIEKPSDPSPVADDGALEEFTALNRNMLNIFGFSESCIVMTPRLHQ
jgi:cytochrome P450